ncbi:MAG: gliding motility protein GldN [Chitinophagia bacterium]|jgi:gliding motility associated protien GldN|nr:gliding motility protein GldN [Chitinophagia bacterium]
MKLKLFTSLMVLGTVALLATDAAAQRTPRRRGGAAPAATTTPEQPTTPVVTDTVPKAPAIDVYANLPFEYDTATADNTIRKSLRQDNAFDKSSLTQRTPLPYEHLRWDDAFYAEKVWRELDLREKMNKVFMYESMEDDGSQIFVNMLMKAVQSGEITAFSDDRFTTPLTVSAVQQLVAGSLDTVPKYDIKQIDKVIGYVVTRKSFDPKSINKIRLKEEWVFDRESSRMHVRILGIGLLKTEYFPNTNKERGTSSLFWVYYPDLRPALVKSEVYNPKNMGQSRITWEELFESRMFSSYIVKSSLDNPQNKLIRNYIKDPILQLLEGENIKEKIFNFEQDLWSY